MHPHKRARRLLVPIAVTLLALAPAARAETTPTAQAVADGGAFLPDAPPPAQPAGLCLVDTGVNTNPDTQESVVSRSAIDGASGQDESATAHGTMLAMLASAPANGWGTVGVAPRSIQLVSVGVLNAGATTFPFSFYAFGITACLELRHKYNIRVINLSLGTSEPPTTTSREMVEQAIRRADNYGVAVVAAAGNDDGGPLQDPAADPLVLSVGASDTQSAGLCSFSNHGDGLRLLAPGCDLDAADPSTGAADLDYWQGTSEASVIAAAALTALEAYRPDLTATSAEELITNAAGGALNIAQSFREAGLSTIVTAGELAQDSASHTGTEANQPQGVAPSKAMTPKPRFTRPIAHIKRSGKHLLLALVHKPSEAQVQARYLTHRPRQQHLRVVRSIKGSFNTLNLPTTGVSEVSLRYLDPYNATRTSPWDTLKLNKTAASSRKGRQ